MVIDRVLCFTYWFTGKRQSIRALWAWWSHLSWHTLLPTWAHWTLQLQWTGKVLLNYPVSALQEEALRERVSQWYRWRNLFNIYFSIWPFGIHQQVIYKLEMKEEDELTVGPDSPLSPRGPFVPGLPWKHKEQRITEDSLFYKTNCQI